MSFTRASASDDLLIRSLDDPDTGVRLRAAHRLGEGILQGRISVPDPKRDTNNHIHTTFSFSPYSPSRAAWEARKAGLATAGIMDHDSVAGAPEFQEAAKALDLPSTVGAELRVSFTGTGLENRRINHPDQLSVGYLAFHGVPERSFRDLTRFLEPVRRARAIRNRSMAVRLDWIAQKAGTRLDYDRDVLPLSEWSDGGTVTERHLLFALISVLLKDATDREVLLKNLVTTFGIAWDDQTGKRLADPSNPYFEYDLLGVFKSTLLPDVYIPATDELVPVRSAVSFALAHGIIPAYPYLGDVRNSITGDKADQRFEDTYLDELFRELKALGIPAVTYMPSRNTTAQLKRLRSLCRAHGMLEISGEDINQPRQSLVCEKMREPEFSGLYDSAWALVGHETTQRSDPEGGLFSAQTVSLLPDLDARVLNFSQCAQTDTHARRRLPDES